MKRSAAAKILTVIGLVLCIAFTFLLTCNIVIIVKGVVNPQTPPTVFGITPMVVQSGSMSGTAEGHLEVGDLIFATRPDAETLNVGDVVSFMDGQIIVTHRIIEELPARDGERQFITKGDANNTADPAIGASSIIGIYRARIPHLGDFAMFVQKPLGMIVFIGIPVCAFIVYDIVRRQRRAGRENAETEALRQELARLRAAAEKPAETDAEL